MDETSPLIGNRSASRSPAGTGADAAQDKQGIPALYDSLMALSGNSPEPSVVSILSHELLSPLTLIKGYAATLLELDRDITPEQKVQYLKGINSAADRVIHLMSNLRDMSRLEDYGGIDLQDVSLQRLLRQAVAEVQSQTSKHALKLREVGRVPQVNIDAQRIQQVIVNLLNNAVKYSPQGGNIVTTVTLVDSEKALTQLSGRPEDLKSPCVVVSVSDEGIGIAEAEMERVFNRFYRVKNRLTKVTPGAGLGLYICRIILQAHHGHIWAGSAPSGGSVFSFALPVE
jgi:signal transduction histidine kinase